MLLFQAASGQDKITLLSGAQIDGRVVAITDTTVVYEQEKRGKTKSRTLDAYRVFDVTYATGETQVVYRQDTAVGNYFSKEEMQLFIMGEQDADANFNSRRAFVFGAAYGVVGGVLLPNNFFVFLVPAAAGPLAAVPRIKIKPEMARDKKLLAEPAYVMGFERTARAKKIQNVLKGSVLGTVLGVAGVNIVKAVEN